MKEIKDMTKEELIDAYREKMDEVYEFANKVREETEYATILIAISGFETDESVQVIQSIKMGSTMALAHALHNENLSKLAKFVEYLENEN